MAQHHLQHANISGLPSQQSCLPPTTCSSSLPVPLPLNGVLWAFPATGLRAQLYSSLFQWQMKWHIFWIVQPREVKAFISLGPWVRIPAPLRIAGGHVKQEIKLCCVRLLLRFRDWYVTSTQCSLSWLKHSFTAAHLNRHFCFEDRMI